MTYKLPSHLEPYRAYLWEYVFSITPMKYQIDLLQRLYDAGLLKTVFKYVVVDKDRKITEKDARNWESS